MSLSLTSSINRGQEKAHLELELQGGLLPEQINFNGGVNAAHLIVLGDNVDIMGRVDGK